MCVLLESILRARFRNAFFVIDVQYEAQAALCVHLCRFFLVIEPYTQVSLPTLMMAPLFCLGGPSILDAQFLLPVLGMHGDEAKSLDLRY